MSLNIGSMMRLVAFALAPLAALRHRIAVALSLAACGGGGKQEAYIEKPVDDLYNTAMDQLANERLLRQGRGDVRAG